MSMPPQADSARRNPTARGGLLKHVSIQSKLILMLVLCTILAATVVGAIAYQTGRNSLRTAAVNRLVQVRETQKRALADEVGNLRNALVTYTHGITAQSALKEFGAGFDKLADATTNPDQMRAIVGYYDQFARDTEKYSGARLDVPALLPTSNAEKYLQYWYSSKLPTNELAIAADDQRDGSAWSAANAKYQGFFREIVSRFAFEDALLIDARGNVVYSVYKNTDLGTNILTGPYNGSKLHDAFLDVMSSNRQERVTITDFEFYQPATMAPTAWMVASLPASGKAEGALAFQFPITKINKLMTFDKDWVNYGLGQTGETLLAGPDYLMRSDSRLFLEDPERYRQEAIDAGTPPDIPDIAIRQGGTTLVQPVSSEAHKQAQEGHSGTLIITDYLGQESLQAYAPLTTKYSDIHWSIVAKVNTAEAFARESTFTRIVVLATTGITFGVCLLAAILARVFIQPIRRLEAGVERIAAGDFTVAIPVENRDEIGELTGAFNDMSRSLSAKDELVDEQQQEIRRLLNAMMPGPIAEKFGSGEAIDARDHQNVTVIYTDIVGLARLQAEMQSGESLAIANELLRQFDVAAADLDIERVRAIRNGYLGSCGLTIPRLDNARRTVEFALACQRVIDRFNSESGQSLDLRSGIDVGSVSSGLIGDPAVMFDLWGTAVNVAYRIKDDAANPGIYVTSRIRGAVGDDYQFIDAGVIRSDGVDEPVWRLTASS